MVQYCSAAIPTKWSVRRNLSLFLFLLFPLIAGRQRAGRRHFMYGEGRGHGGMQHAINKPAKSTYPALVDSELKLLGQHS
eukprot:scaffold9079_cov145-Skeletonema_menzelii.AAC.6